MSERSHSPAAHNAGFKRRVGLVLVGTAAAVVVAGVLIQFFSGKDGKSAEEPAAGQASGRASLTATANKQPLARIGNKVVYYDDVAAECYARHGHEVLDKMINRLVIQHACEERGVAVTADEVNQEIVQIAGKFNLAVDNWFQMLQAEKNITPQQYQRDIIWPMLALKKLAGENVTVTEEDMQQAFVRDYGPRVETKLIMFDNQRRAMEVWEKANQNPEEFGRLAREYSIEPTSRALEGDVPPIRRYSGNEKLEERAFKLQPGEISGVIEIGTAAAKRYVILKCEGHTKPVVDSMDEVREALYKQLMEEKTQEAVAKVFEQIKEETPVMNFLTQQSTGGKQSVTDGIKQTAGTGAAGQVRPAAARTSQRPTATQQR
jgi:foldase protein PrsA